MRDGDSRRRRERGVRGPAARCSLTIALTAGTVATEAARPVLLSRPVEVCTIIAKNYVAHARVLARVACRAPSGRRLWTLIIDDFSGYIDAAEEPFEVLTPRTSAAGRSCTWLALFGARALDGGKAMAAPHLMRGTGAPVTYLDPDIRLYGRSSRWRTWRTDTAWS